MKNSRGSPCAERNNFMKTCLEKEISKSLFLKMCETMRPFKSGSEKEAQAKRLCEIIASSKTEEEILERMDALE